MDLLVFAIRRPGMRCSRIRENEVIGLVIAIDVIAKKEDRRIRWPAGHRCEGDVDNVVS